MIELVILLLTSYITGSFPTSIVMTRAIKNIDIRDHGSGNAGATNVFRVLGWKYAIFVLVFDIFLPLCLPRMLGFGPMTSSMGFSRPHKSFYIDHYFDPRLVII